MSGGRRWRDPARSALARQSDDCPRPVPPAAGTAVLKEELRYAYTLRYGSMQKSSNSAETRVVPVDP